MSIEVLVVPKNGQGHLFPCMELCKQLIHRFACKITVVVDSDISSSVPTSLLQSPLFDVFCVDQSSDSSPQSSPFHREQEVLVQGIESVLTRPGATRPVCAVVDHIMNKTQTQEVCARFGVPTVTFITSSACWAAVQHAAWVVQPGDMKPGEVRALPGLPEGMVLSYSDLKQRGPGRPARPAHLQGSRGGGGGGDPAMPRMMRGPPLPGQPAPWVEEVKSSAAILFNTCDDLDRPFLDYVSNLTGKPVWGVGPLLPEQYWKSIDSLLQERDIRPKRESNYTDDEIIGWLDRQPRGSVMFVSFGSEVSPSTEEYPELASALEESPHPFIWIIQRKSGNDNPAVQYFPHGLDSKVGKRGLIIHGWAPQLLILSHPSLGGFLTHCGWNSTIEAIVRGVPLLAWPIRGDQYYNAKLVVNYLKIGAMISEDYPEAMVKKEDIAHGIETVLNDGAITRNSLAIQEKFMNGFPASSIASLEAFMNFVIPKKAD